MLGNIESVKLKRSIKFGKKVWMEGVELKAPLPPEILNEIELGNPNIEILGRKKQSANSSVKIEHISKPVYKGPQPTTQTTYEVYQGDEKRGGVIKFSDVPKVEEEEKPVKLVKRVKLIKRKKRK